MTAELQRRIANIIRFGLIYQVNLANATAQVQIGNLITDFLPFATCRTGTTKSWSPPTVGEQCIVLAMNGELTTACILLGLYTQNSPSQSGDEHIIEFADGAKFIYNQASSALSVANIKTAVIQASQSVTADTPQVICTKDLIVKGNVSITGNTAIQGGLTAKGNIQSKGAINADKNITSKQDVKAGDISLQNHFHTEQGDGADTSKAKQ